MTTFFTRCRRAWRPTFIILVAMGILLNVTHVVLVPYIVSTVSRQYTAKSRRHFVSTTQGHVRPFTIGSDVSVQFMTPRFRSWEKLDVIIRDHEDSQCPWTCRFFHKWGKRDKSSAHMLLFEAFDLAERPDYVPSRRSPDQVWVLVNPEGPWMTKLPMSLYNNVFNWTSFVRLDSDVPYRYGRIRKRATRQQLTSHRVKGRHAFWMSSNCVPLNHRDAYVDELQRHLAVDILSDSSACQPAAFTCAKGLPRCDNLADEYNFYLAFENANCRDYITEKFWRSLRTGVIPVVMGDSEGYRKVAPPGSYIDVADFRSPKELAQYLLQVRNVMVIIGQRWSPFRLRNRPNCS